MSQRSLRVLYILPSKYDDDGYVLRHWRGVLPSNSLCVLKQLTEQVAASGELGGDVRVDVEIYDDTVQRLPLRRIVRLHQRGHERVVVGLVAVQTNQFARATDIIMELRRHGVPVMIGGFHVSGILALFDTPSPELQRLLDAGVTLVKGEAEAPGALAAILRDAVNGTLAPYYNITEFPALENVPAPLAESRYLRRFTNRRMATIDTSRGCPFNCSFCTIINVQGRQMRSRSAAHILEALQRNYERGIRSYFFTDDNFGRSPVRDAVLEGMAVMRERGMELEFMMQIDTRAHLIPGFVEKAARAGCYMVFIGMETVNPANLETIGKAQNDVSDYKNMVETWRSAGAIIHVGYIIGLACDTVDSVRQDIETLKNLVKVDVASFFMLTPAPGSSDHHEMVERGEPMDADLNNFDSLHETFRHQRMAPGTWRAVYRESWHRLYNKENIVNVLLRTPRHRYRIMFWTLVWYRFSTLAEVHPMFAGHLRLKGRRDRRPGFPREGLLAYATQRGRDLGALAALYARLFFEFQEIWLLTRKRDDARWSTLADLRARWVMLQEHIQQSSLADGREAAARYVRDMLESSAERLRALTESGRILNGRAQRKVQMLAQEIEHYLGEFDVQMPTWHDIVRAQEYVSNRVIAGYEEVTIRYVARRRRFNHYHRQMLHRLRRGQIAVADLIQLPMVLAFELALGIRFGYRLLFHSGNLS
jgi:hypothetical protein